MTKPVLGFQELIYAWLGNQRAILENMTEVFWDLLVTTDYYGEYNQRNIEEAIKHIHSAMLYERCLEETTQDILDKIGKEEHLLYPGIIRELFSGVPLEEIKKKLEDIRGVGRPV